MEKLGVKAGETKQYNRLRTHNLFLFVFHYFHMISSWIPKKINFIFISLCRKMKISMSFINKTRVFYPWVSVTDRVFRIFRSLFRSLWSFVWIVNPLHLFFSTLLKVSNDMSKHLCHNLTNDPHCGSTSFICDYWLPV